MLLASGPSDSVSIRYIRWHIISFWSSRAWNRLDIIQYDLYFDVNVIADIEKNIQLLFGTISSSLTTNYYDNIMSYIHMKSAH